MPFFFLKYICLHGNNRRSQSARPPTPHDDVEGCEGGPSKELSDSQKAKRKALLGNALLTDNAFFSKYSVSPTSEKDAPVVEKRKPTTCHEGGPLTARERSAWHSSDDDGSRSSQSAQSLPNMNAAIQLARASRKKIEEEESKREGTGTTPLSPRTLQFQLPGNHDDEKDGGGHHRPSPGDRRLSSVVPPSLLPPLPLPPSDSIDETSDGSPTPRTPHTPRSPRGGSLTDTAEVSAPAEPASPAKTQGSPRTATPPYDLSKQKEEYQTLIKVSCIYLLFYFILFIYFSSQLLTKKDLFIGEALCQCLPQALRDRVSPKVVKFFMHHNLALELIILLLREQIDATLSSGKEKVIINI